MTSTSHNILVDLGARRERKVEDLSGLMDGIAKTGRGVRVRVWEHELREPRKVAAKVRRDYETLTGLT
jgi:hypothetical protein